MTSNGTDINKIDLERFNQVFFEECGEHLVEMERILVSLGDSEPDDEQLNAIFRAAHSIKGGAGIFGFQDMTVVTHVLESLLDKLRTHEIPFSTAMIDLFLEAGDVISMQLAGHRDGAEVDQEAVDRIRTKLQQVVDGESIASTPEKGVPTVLQVEGEPEAAPGATTALHRYEMIFSPDPDIFKRGVRLENLLTELGELGALTVHAQVADCDDFTAIDPEVCHTSWRFCLETTASEADIREIFEFVADEEQLEVRDCAVGSVTVEQATDQSSVAPVAAPEDGIQVGRRAYDKDELAPAAYGRRTSEAEASIRVGVTKVDQLINQVGELVITQLMLAQTAAGLDPVHYENLHRTLLQLERNTRDLQQSVMSIRLVPISIVFSRFPRMVRELAAKLGKQVELKTFGESTELDKGLIEKITDPLTHLVRNCMDHALETPEVRVGAGKERSGTITLRASQIGGRIVIDVLDDGAGLNRDKILHKAAERGIATSDNMTDEEVWQLIFAPGFSTADAVTDISGRGVGMDVVLRNVQAMSGRVNISSESGKGTRVTISLPLTLAILDGLSVAVGEEKFIIPLNSIIESLQPDAASLKTVNGNRVVQVRGDYIPIIPLYELFNMQARVTEPEQGILILIDVDGEKAALLVDALLDEHQVVIKSIETNYRKVDGTAGATILGDGRVALILDVNSLLQMRKTKVNFP
ncbi:MAG: chemotaxis protein CheW [Desulfuromonadaceae bacterium]|nr:chemotaxis protein CheW [Desulfuromonadaceae bacterium]MDD2847953.1 chemotaxis protein CheW [Desulfuromonadaceae bacterium]MDD4131305.1 chemotaxis protein CheW [Desulfuromonadaceae bacterium]